MIQISQQSNCSARPASAREVYQQLGHDRVYRQSFLFRSQQCEVNGLFYVPCKCKDSMNSSFSELNYAPCSAKYFNSAANVTELGSIFDFFISSKMRKVLWRSLNPIKMLMRVLYT